MQAVQPNIAARSPRGARGRTLPVRLANINHVPGFKRLRTIAHLTGISTADRATVFEVVRQAMLDVLPQHQRNGMGVSPALTAVVLDRAATLLKQTYADETLPTKRRKLLVRALYIAMRTYSPDAAGHDVHYDVDVDLPAADAMLRGAISDAYIATIVAEMNAKGIHINAQHVRHALPVALCAGAASILRRCSAMPVTAIEGALRMHNLPDHGSFVRALVGTLQTVGALVCKHHEYGPEFCRKYLVAGMTLRLPFVARAIEANERYAVYALIARNAEQNIRTKAAIDGARAILGDHEECLLSCSPSAHFIHSIHDADEADGSDGSGETGDEGWGKWVEMWPDCPNALVWLEKVWEALRTCPDPR